GRAIQIDVVRNKGVGREPLDNWMPAVGNDHLVAVVQVRLGVIGDGRGLGERSEDVEGRQRASGVLDARRLSSYATSQVLEDLQLALEDPLVCAEHLGLVLFECRRRE